MSGRAFIFLACAPNARAGVSTTARVLSDYYLAGRRSFIGFDTDPHEPDYAHRFGERAKSVDLASVKDQIAMIDRLLGDDEDPKIVDLWSRSFDRFFQLAREIDFFAEARRKNIEPVILYHADASGASPAAAFRLASEFPDVQTILVHNEGAAPFEGDEQAALNRFPGHRRFILHALDPTLRAALADPALSLSYFLLDPPPHMSIVVRAGLRAWLTPIFTQWHSFEMRETFARTEFFG